MAKNKKNKKPADQQSSYSSKVQDLSTTPKAEDCNSTSNKSENKK